MDSNVLIPLTERVNAIVDSLAGAFVQTAQTAAERITLAAQLAQVQARMAAFAGVLDAIGAPSEVSGIPAEEIGLPVLEQLRIFRCAPTARDRIAFEIDIDAALLRLRHELLVRDLRVAIRAGHGPGLRRERGRHKQRR